MGITTAANNAVRKNILDLVNVATGASLLAVDITDTTAIRIYYNGAPINSFSVNVVSGYSTLYTTLSMTVLDSSVIAGSSADSGWNPSYPINNNVDPTGIIYRLYLSNPTDASAGGTAQNVVISGELQR